jgi:hypothetical protein
MKILETIFCFGQKNLPTARLVFLFCTMLRSYWEWLEPENEVICLVLSKKKKCWHLQ